MKISGFTMVRNAGKYHFPIKESIESILPIVDEFIVALGNNDEGDNTRAQIESIQSDKVKIIDRVWDENEFVDGKIFANETSFALSQCSGDWCFYLQADEVIHEDDLEHIKQNCETHLNNPKVDGFILKYNHFWGDEKHYLPFHGWYRNEIRIVRNNNNIYSYKDAQSFRKNDDEKLNVIALDAYVYHYGWVRPPEIMQSKKKEQHIMHHGDNEDAFEFKTKFEGFNYGALGRVPIFDKSHPKVMDNYIQNIYWKDQLNYTKTATLDRGKLKHERLKYRIVSWLENNLLGGKDIGGFKNYIEL